MREQTKQTQMFAEDAWRQTFTLIPKLPFAFSYQIEDAAGKKSAMQVLDWECGQLYWNCLRRHSDESIALEKVKMKYFDEFSIQEKADAKRREECSARRSRSTEGPRRLRQGV